MNKSKKLVISAAVVTLGWVAPTYAQVRTINLPTVGQTNPNTNANAVFTSTGATIGGGTSNWLGSPPSTAANYATVSGGSSNWGTQDYTTIGGGYDNTASGDYATVGGGEENTASGDNATVGGGLVNTASGDQATVGGGRLNVASGFTATIGGGLQNEASDVRSTVAGGHENKASGFKSFVGGGYLNEAAGLCSTVGAGDLNEANGVYSTISGGGPSDTTNPTTKQNTKNLTTDDYGTIGGGGGNQAGDNAGTEADAIYATVGGGKDNTASGSYSVVTGGRSNTASGTDSFAAGNGNTASGNGSFAAGVSASDGGYNNVFIWGDSGGGTATAANQFNIHASGGILLNGTVMHASDRAMKEGFSTISALDVLEKVVDMPVTTWRFKSEDDSVRHIGPVAQDFMAAFGYGAFDTYITATDADGVALAAIQGLNMKLVEKDNRIDALEKRLVALEELLLAKASLN